VPTINYDECKKTFSAGGRHLPWHVICLGLPSGGKSSCFGDSGGPMVCKHDGKYWQYGVSSFGFSKKCARPNEPVGYADVVAYLPWIKQKLGGLYSKMRYINTDFNAFDGKSKLIKEYW